MKEYCPRCECRHAPPVALNSACLCPNTAAERFCGCGHKIDDCAPENCRHEFARDAMWGNS